MICPYICHVIQTNQNRYEYDEEGRNTFHEHILAEQKVPLTCAREDCGAWRDGRCRTDVHPAPAGRTHRAK